ncbi:hypothetical protein ANN_13152 [Periplaneta americana]|uniref:THAP-type domain-containing protein n=1 Tax=Periplaneta americana TaxID=6978 RepID=A0ABQ8TIL8_PERAM|nr:hypothetical protein ANN_13152 [Periplaneta americana]
MESYIEVSPSEPGRGRRRVRDTKNWTKQKTDRRYSARSPPRSPTCNHKAGAFQCSLLSRRDINHFHKVFYSIPKKLVQDAFILKYTAADYPRTQKKNISAVRHPGIGACCVLQVCRQTFLGILQISKDRVGLICKRHFETGLPPVEKRGGDTRSNKYEIKRSTIKNLIDQLGNMSELHYCRGQVKGRQYLQSNLNISKFGECLMNLFHLI